MEDLSQKIMELIFYAGNAKSMALQAVMKAEDQNIDEAKNLLDQAKQEIHKAHEIQTNLMTKEIQGEPIEKSILLIHSQDHFMAANTTIELGERLIKVYEKLLEQ